MTKLTEPELLDVIRTALEDQDGQVTIESGIGTLDAWDSLGHLSILAALDTRLAGKAADLEELAGAKSVREIFQILKNHQLA